MSTFQAKEFRNLRVFGWSIIGLLVLTFLIWGTIAKLNSAVIAEGNLEIAGYKQVVQHDQGGVVDQLLVSNGVKVEQGDILLSIDSQNVRPEYEIYNRLYIEALAEKGRLIAERDSLAAPKFPEALLELADTEAAVEEATSEQTELFQLRREAVENEISLLDEQEQQLVKRLAGRELEKVSLQSQVQLAKNEGVRVQRLVNRGLSGKGAIATVEQQIAQLDGQVARMDSDLAELQDQISQVAIERLKLNAKPREEAVERLRELEKNEVEFFQNRLRNKAALEKLEVRAPLSGVVYGLTVFKSGTVISPAEPIMYIVPDGDDEGMVVRGRLVSSDITEVQIGQEAELKFAAFTDRSIPYISGKVINISADAFTDEATGMRYYEIEVAPEADAMDKLGATVLTPGQPVSLFLHTGAQTFLDYILKPITDNFDRAFRES